MLRTRISQAFLIGLLASGATFCALAARGAEPAEGHRTYSLVSQSDATSAATGRLPLAPPPLPIYLGFRVHPLLVLNHVFPHALPSESYDLEPTSASTCVRKIYGFGAQ